MLNLFAQKFELTDHKILIGYKVNEDWCIPIKHMDMSQLLYDPHRQKSHRRHQKIA